MYLCYRPSQAWQVCMVVIVLCILNNTDKYLKRFGAPAAPAFGSSFGALCDHKVCYSFRPQQLKLII